MQASDASPPRQPESTAVEVPNDGCTAACTNLEKLGWCDLFDANATPGLDICKLACERLNGQKALDGTPITALDTACVAAAKSCNDVIQCD